MPMWRNGRRNRLKIAVLAISVLCAAYQISHSLKLMEIGTIGAGDFAQAFAKRALKASHKVKLSNSRGPESLRGTVNQLGPGAVAATTEEAAACEMVLLAVPWDNVPETLASLPTWKNQILIDGTNPFHGQAEDFTPPDLANPSTSHLLPPLPPPPPSL